PPAGSFIITLVPAVFSVVLVVAAVGRYGLPQLNRIDWIVILIVFATVITNELHFDYAISLSGNAIARVLALYFAFRILAEDARLLRQVTITTFTVGALLAVEGVYERLNERNIFLELRTPGYLASTWGKLQLRFGEVRAAASFGHPIALGMFVATCIVLGFALYITTQRTSAKAAIILGEVALVGGLWATLTRGPILMAVLGFVLFALRARGSRGTLFGLGAVGAGVAYVSPLGDQIDKLIAGQQSDQIVASSTEYRQTLIQALFDPQYWSLLGQTRVNPYNVQQAFNYSIPSVDNEYLLRLVSYGGVGLVLFAAVAVLVVWVALTENDPLYRAWAAATASAAACLLTVALLLQEADFFWIGVAITAAALATRRSRRREDRRVEMVPAPAPRAVEGLPA
ncbi:MAG: hypothetical protein INR66_26460, partial [Gordonia polyisoprenivorans]|nr:hypothetical protein [Gordonia polyisoprenivorans]